MSSGHLPRPAARARLRGAGALGRALLRVPLFYKILLANAAIVLVGAVAGGLAMARYVRAAPGRSPADLVGLLAGAGVVLSLVVNALILRLALRPLALLERTAARVRGGDLTSRVPLSPVADRELDRLARTFNAMLDASAADRQRLRDVAARALGAAEEERKRIARELHDETAQRLAALLLRLRLLRGAADSAALGGGLDGLRVEIGDVLEGVRRFARGLRPPALDDLGLRLALESHARAVAEASGVAIEFAPPGEPVDNLLSTDAELALYRIVQEALSNAVRHSGARRVRLRVAREGDRIIASIADDGRGFDPARPSAAEGAGLGLFGMRERAAYLGGEVEIRAAPGAGTEVVAVIPLGSSAAPEP